MQKFNHRSFILKRPVTVPSIAEALDAKPYELMEEFVALDLFPGPSDVIPDLDVHMLSKRIEAEFEIQEGH